MRSKELYRGRLDETKENVDDTSENAQEKVENRDETKETLESLNAVDEDDVNAIESGKENASEISKDISQEQIGVPMESYESEYTEVNQETK